MPESTPNKKSKNDAVKDIVNALGVIAEVSLVFYRDVLNSGAAPDEAFKLTQAFIAANIFGNAGRSKPDVTTTILLILGNL